jgi:hypothetical protein
VTSILYPLVVAALLPLSLADALARLPDIARRLEPPSSQPEARQVNVFRVLLRKRRPRCASG